MNGNKTIGALALSHNGRTLRSLSAIRARLPFRLEDLVAQLGRKTKEDDYLRNAAETMRLAENVRSPAERTRLATLAEGWIELAEKAREDNRRPRRPIILHPLVQKKMGMLPE
jgi:hypothetical protein